MKKTEKKNIAFISYSKEDKDFAEDIHSLLIDAISEFDLSETVFMDTKNINTEDWRKIILTSIKNSYCFIPIFTKNSINSSWVNFELGLARASNIPIYPIITKTIRADQIPCCESSVHRLDSKSNISTFISNICDVGKSNEVKLEGFIRANPAADRIKRKSSERWVYIIGSMPNFNTDDEKNSWKKRSNYFLTTLTKRLLEAEFCLTSFPTVEYVGSIVINKICEIDKIENYSIAGLYGIDNDIKKVSEKIPKIKPQKWDTIISNFRKTYLKNQHFVIVVGGKNNTKEEIDAAKNEKLKFIPIPCFSGTGEEYWLNTHNNNRDFCLNHDLCKDYKNCTDNCNKIDGIINLLNDRPQK